MVVFSPENGGQVGVHQCISRTWWCFHHRVFLGGAPAVQHRPSSNFPSLLPQFQGNQPFPGAMSSMINDCWRHECRCFQNIFLQRLHSQQIPVTGVPADSPWIRLPNPKEKVRKKYRDDYLGFESIKQKKRPTLSHLKLYIPRCTKTLWQRWKELFSVKRNLCFILIVDVEFAWLTLAQFV